MNMLIMVQAIYGNRNYYVLNDNTIELNALLSGLLDMKHLPVFEDEIKNMKRVIKHIPTHDKIVIVYDGEREKRVLVEKEELARRYNIPEDKKLKPLAYIPEEDYKIFSRCLVCRINDDNELVSLEEGDERYFIHYLAR